MKSFSFFWVFFIIHFLLRSVGGNSAGCVVSCLTYCLFVSLLSFLLSVLFIITDTCIVSHHSENRQSLLLGHRCRSILCSLKPNNNILPTIMRKEIERRRQRQEEEKRGLTQPFARHSVLSTLLTGIFVVFNAVLAGLQMLLLLERRSVRSQEKNS